MNRYFKTLTMAAAVGFLASCSNNGDIVPATPTEGYHLTFDGSVGIETGTRASWNDDKGSGNLIFQWDYTPDNATESELKMAFGKEGNWLESKEGYSVTDVKILEHTDPAKAGDKHWAKFETIETYTPELSENVYDGFRIHAVTPINVSNNIMDVYDGELTATLDMPQAFTQSASQKPEFLRDYMYMYATSIIAGGSASLSFKHIPATFRFIITNKRPTVATLKSVTVSLADATQPVASQSATISSSNGAEAALTFSQDSYTKITTDLLPNGAAVQKDDKYTAYALALPLADNNAFYGKKIQFTIATDSEPANEYLSFVLDADQLAGANPNGEYNWVSGKSYTIRMSLSDVLAFEGITVTDWANGGVIDGGVAKDASIP